MQIILTMNHLYKNSMRREYSVVEVPYFPWMTPTIAQLAMEKSLLIR